MGRGGTFDPDAVVRQVGRVVTRTGRFGGFVVVRAVAGDRAVLLARDLLQRARGGHDEQVAQLAEPSHAVHLREGEAFDRGVFVTVSGAVVAARDGVRADLHHAEGRRGPREGLAQTVIDACGGRAGARADEGVHVTGRVESFGGSALPGAAAGEPRRRGRQCEKQSRLGEVVMHGMTVIWSDGRFSGRSGAWRPGLRSRRPARRRRNCPSCGR